MDKRDVLAAVDLATEASVSPSGTLFARPAEVLCKILLEILVQIPEPRLEPHVEGRATATSDRSAASA
jgi:hypothetical protein